MKIAMLSPVAWRTPPRHYGPWEQVASNITEGLIKEGMEVTLFATSDSVTSARLESTIEKGYEEDTSADAKVAECLHISYLMERAGTFDIIHNHFDFLPLTYSRLISTPMLTTIHGFSSEKIVPVYKRYNDINYYVSISNADRHSSLKYLATIYHGVKQEDFVYNNSPDDYLLFFGRIHPDKGTHDAIAIAKGCNKRLIIAGIIQDANYYEQKVKPFLDNEQISFVGHADAGNRVRLLSNAFALLHPIYFAEPFGLSVAEAMFCGTPVIAYSKGSMPELIENNVSGYLVSNLQEAIDAVHQVSKINRHKCYKYATEKFSYNTMIKNYIDAYRQVLNR